MILHYGTRYDVENTEWYLRGAYRSIIYEPGGTKYLIVASYVDGSVSIFDITDPFHFIQVSEIKNSHTEGITGIVTFGNYLALVSYTGDELAIYDISNPASPSLEASVDGDGSPNYLGGAYAIDYDSNSDHLAIASHTDNCICFYDVSSPGSPSLTSRISGEGSPNYMRGVHDVKFIESGDYLLAVSYFDNALVSIDTSDIGDPDVADVIEGDGSPYYLKGAHSIEVHGNYAYVSGYYDNAISVFDISNPENMSHENSIVGSNEPYYLHAPTRLEVAEIEGTDYLLVASYLDDAIVMLDISIPSAPALKEVQNDELFDLDGIHDLLFDSDVLYVCCHDANGVVVFSTEVEGEGIELSGISEITTDATCTAQIGQGISLSGTCAIVTNVPDVEAILDVEAFLMEIDQPHYYPVRRLYIHSSTGEKIDITDMVYDFNEVLWQIEQQYHPNVFTANSCTISLVNDDSDFDVDNASNYFTTIGYQADGYHVPFSIECGFLIDGQELLLTVFYGLAMSVQTSSDDNAAKIDLQCVSSILRETKCENIGNQWTGARLYGGNTFTHLASPINKTSRQVKASGESFSSGFPPYGYIRINDEIIYYSYLSADGFEGCIRGAFDTSPAIPVKGDRIDLILNDGDYTDGVRFQFLASPVQRGDINISSSDGVITIMDEREYLINVQNSAKKTTGYLDYETGILELLDEPTDSGSLTASYYSAYRMIPYHELTKRILKAQNMSISQIEAVKMYDYLGRSVPNIFGRINYADSENMEYNIASSDLYAIATDSDNNVYAGIGSYLVKWDGSSFRMLANLGADNIIYRIGTDNNGNVYGVSGKADATTLRNIFKYDNESVSYLQTNIATYLNIGDGYEGGQWRGFSVDTTNKLIWFIHGGTYKGVAKMNYDGSGLVKYYVNAVSNNSIDMVDTGTTIEIFFTEYDSTFYYIKYSQLVKSTGVVGNVGIILASTNQLRPYDAVYNSGEGKIYMNIMEYSNPNWWYKFYSFAKGSVSKTQLDVQYTKGFEGRYCGGVQWGNYVWFVKGTGDSQGYIWDAVGKKKEYNDSATGHLYRVNNNVIEDMGFLALRDPRDSMGTIRDPVTGHTAVMAATADHLWFASSDVIMGKNQNQSYAFGQYGEYFTPLARMADLGERNIWDVLSELAILSCYELGISSTGKVFYRARESAAVQLDGAINESVATIPIQGTDIENLAAFGTVQIDSELIHYVAVDGTNLTGCERGYKGSVAALHDDESYVWPVSQILGNLPVPYGQNIISIDKDSNIDEVYNYISVPYGDKQAIFDWQAAGEIWEESSEYKYGRRELNISNQFLTADDWYIALTIGWAHYDLFSARHSVLDIQTKWQPQLQLGDMVTVKHSLNVAFDYILARVRRIRLDMNNFVTSVSSVLRPAKRRRRAAEGEYWE